MTVMITVSLLLLSAALSSTGEKARSDDESLAAWVADVIPSIKWCGEALQCNNVENVVCGRNRREVVELRKNCYNLKSTTTPQFRRKILSLHNRLRNKVAGGLTELPAAANMRQLSWDVISETTASVWITYCRVGIAECRKTPHSPQGTGQNYFLLGTDTANTDGKGPPPDSVPSFETWVAAIPFIPHHWIPQYHINKSLMDSLAQIITAKVSTLGCSEATYAQSGFKFRVLVCNYDKLLVEGKPLYKIGPPCSECQEGRACNNRSEYPHLCALPDDPDNDGPPINVDEFIAPILSEGNFVHRPPDPVIHAVSVFMLLYIYTAYHRSYHVD